MKNTHHPKLTYWRLIDSGPCGAAFNMALDEALSASVRKGICPPTLRLYTWSTPSVSIGAFQKISAINADYCCANDIPIVRRPTGGRAILHGHELTYSFCAPNLEQFSGGLMDSYRKLGCAFRRCFELTGLDCTMKNDRETGRQLVKSPLCFASTSLGEITSRGMKIIGSAQKRWKDGFLQQGCIPFSVDKPTLAAILKLPASGLPNITENSMIAGLRDLIPDFNPEMFRRHLARAFEETFGVTLVVSLPSPQELEFAHQLASEKYQMLHPDSLRGVREVTADSRSYNNEETGKLK